MEGGFCRGSKEGDIYWIVGMVGFESFDGGICVFDGRSGVSLDGRWVTVGLKER